MTSVVASSRVRTYGLSALDEFMSTTGVSIAIGWCTAVTLLGIVASSRSTTNDWVSLLPRYSTKVLRSSPPRTGCSVGAGIRDGSRAGRRSSRTLSSDRLAERRPCVIGNEPCELLETAGESHVSALESATRPHFRGTRTL